MGLQRGLLFRSRGKVAWRFEGRVGGSFSGLTLKDEDVRSNYHRYLKTPTCPGAMTCGYSIEEVN